MTVHNGNLEIRNSSDAEKYKNVTKVTGYLYIHSSAKLDAPALTSVGGYLSIHSKGSLAAGKLYCGGYDKFAVIDNIGCVVLSEKQANGVTVLLCRHSKIKTQKVIGDKFYVARKDGENAHGKTIADATQELLFKIGPRDVERYRNMPLTTTKTPAEWALVYRTITGACQYGTNQFIESRGKMKKKYTLSEIVALTKGQWGHDKFAAVVSAVKAA